MGDYADPKRDVRGLGGARVLSGWGLLAGLCTLGCSSSSFSGEPEPDGEAVVACRDLVDAWCGTATRCAVDAGIIAAADDGEERLSCVEQGEDVLGCSMAAGTDDGYGACMGDIATISCVAIVEPLQMGAAPELPESCHGVIQVPE